MGIINNILDNFNKAEFTVAPSKKLKTISADFMSAFNLKLVFYKGVTIADGDLTLSQLNQKTSQNVITNAEGLTIKGSTKVGDAEKMFKSQFGVTVQIKTKDGKNHPGCTNDLVPNNLTIGKAARGEK